MGVSAIGCMPPLVRSAIENFLIPASFWMKPVATGESSLSVRPCFPWVLMEPMVPGMGLPHCDFQIHSCPLVFPFPLRLGRLRGELVNFHVMTLLPTLR